MRVISYATVCHKRGHLEQHQLSDKVRLSWRVFYKTKCSVCSWFETNAAFILNIAFETAAGKGYFVFEWRSDEAYEDIVARFILKLNNELGATGAMQVIAQMFDPSETPKSIRESQTIQHSYLVG